ncbi:MAG: response regulator [bacterium]|nr:response regulator [bacterium]
MKKILLIEPDAVIAKAVVDYLPKHDILIVSNGHQAIAALESWSCELIISEHSFLTHNSFEFLYELRSYPEWEKLPFVLFTKTYIHDSLLHSDAFKELGISGYLYKPQTRLSDLKSKLNLLSFNAAYN